MMHNDNNHHTHHIHHSADRLMPKQVFLIALLITLMFGCVEALAGFYSGSLALLSDAGHMLTDSLALGLAGLGAWFATLPPSDRHSYGLGRAEIIAALLSSLLMLLIATGVIIEAIKRFYSPLPVMGHVVMVVASLGLLTNTLVAWLLSKSHKTLNTHAAMLHVLSDLLGSIAALLSGAIIYFSGWTRIDPILSIFISLLIILGGIRLVRDTLRVLMEGVPAHLELSEVSEAMSNVKDVNSIHDLHIWTLTSGLIVLSAHVVIENMALWEDVLSELQTLLSMTYGIKHLTLQPETSVTAHLNDSYSPEQKLTKQNP